MHEGQIPENLLAQQKLGWCCVALNRCLGRQDHAVAFWLGQRPASSLVGQKLVAFDAIALL